MMSVKYEYTDQDFNFETNWDQIQKSNFDEELMSKWSSLQEEGSCFRYKLKIDKCKELLGNYKYLSQLNTDRGTNRRKPVNVQSMSQKFDPDGFNFTKIDPKEVSFEVSNENRHTSEKNYLVINTSPLELGHSLLLPSLYECLPQVVTQTSLLVSLEIFLLSKSPALRMGFNGLQAFASLNHLHFHLYYLHHRMLLETIEVENLSGPCYVLTKFPSQGFAFQLASGQDIEVFSSDVFKLVSFLQKNEKPHNIFFTRGTSFESSKEGPVRDHVRVYVWARKPNDGPKEISAFQPAICELFGHLVIKNAQDYETLTEEVVSEIMADLTQEQFQSVVGQVKELYEKNITHGSL